MIELNEMTPKEMWNRMRLAMYTFSDVKPDDPRFVSDREEWGKLWKNWGTTNTLKFLNLQPRLKGQGLEELRRFYAAHKEVDESKAGEPPSWWDSLEWFYAKAKRSV